ncbi:uncharacterized protein LOC34622360 [Cyclospora cayetanensis]|uniref:Uncharacterized protein LOC34622360 n=1 Tax=Cyclospora cayetanensis TaxID=88456 RepID=A0A6P6S1L0_9EIME|nr:uncharacterized protein LOC34622360 [Cyclospora cayetanensis]
MTSIFSKVSEQYGELVNFIIRPPRDTYSDADLGPSTFLMAGRQYKRTDLELINRRSMRLQCSHFEPVLPPGKRKKLPCVIYLHGNCSSRIEAMSALPVLLPQNITVFAFDFSGSGRSDGPYISLGWWERDDLDTVIEHLRSLGTVSSVGLWGRSMGAVTALMHAHRDPSIGGMVLDSPFAALRRLAEELSSVVMQFNVPKFVLSILLSLVRSSILSKAQFDINVIAPIDNLAEAYIPALFVYGREDNFISPQHVKDLYAAYRGDKNIIDVEGGHNSPRPAFMLHSAAIFFRNTLDPLALSRAGRERTGETRDLSEDVEGSRGSPCNAPVIPVHPFDDEAWQKHAAAAAVAATPGAAAAPAAAASAAGSTHLPGSQQQKQQQALSTHVPAAQSKREEHAHRQLDACACIGKSVSVQEATLARLWRRFLQCVEAPSLVRCFVCSKVSFLRWGTGKGRQQSAAQAAAGSTDSSSSAVVTANSGQGAERQRNDEGLNSAPQGATAAGDAATGSQADAVKSMAPPEPSFRFFNNEDGMETTAFIEDEDDILQRAISISLEEFIREQQQQLRKAADPNAKP